MMKYFPHFSIRSGQDQLIKDLQKTFQEHKILLAQAPTGLGKTASALSVAVEFAIREKKKVFFLTNRHTQHRIAVETLKKMREKTGEKISCVDMIGKRWMCSQEIAGLFGKDFNEFCKVVVERGECEFYNNVRSKKSVTVEAKVLISELAQESPLHNEELIKMSKEKRMCSYEIALALMKDANIIIADYNYIFNPHVQTTIFNKLEIDFEDIILIIDEGHNLPSRIMDILSNTLTSNMLKNAIIEAKKFGYNGIIYWLQEMMRILTTLATFSEKSRDREKLITKEQFAGEIRKIMDYEELINELEIVADEVRKKQRRSYLGGISSFLGSWKGEDLAFARILSEESAKQGPLLVLHYYCLDPSLLTREIFARVYAGVIMSGTLNPTFMYKDILGIGKGEEKEYSSPFPLENKLTLIVPETSTKYNLRGEAMYRKIAEKCSHFGSLIPGNVAFFFPSYELRDRICFYFISPKKQFFEKSEMSKEEKESFLNSFRAVKEKGGVLLGVTGANFAEGIDLPGDLLNGVIVVGLPLAKPDLKTREIIKYYQQVYG